MYEEITYEATLNFIPPSVNRMYRPSGFGGKRLSKESERFQTKAKESLLKQWLFKPKKLNPNSPKRLVITIYFEKMHNKGWPKKAKFRYKRQDITNYIKLLEDVISDCTGCDDSSNVQTVFTKMCDPNNPRVEICYTQVPTEQHLLLEFKGNDV